MPQDVKDVTDQVDPPWYERIDVFLKSKKVLKGTFCFPFGNGFGCGSTMSVTKGEEFSLSATLGAEIKGITGEVTVGATYTQQTEWSYTAKPCEYCRPDICFPDSTLTIYERYIVPTPFTMEIQQFEPGPRGQIESNCIQNDPLCKCGPQTALVPQDSNVNLLATGPAFDTVIFRAIGPFKPVTELPEPVVLAQAFSDAIDRQWRLAHVRATRPVALGVVEPHGVINYLRPLGRSAPTVSLLSRTARGYSTSGQEVRLGPRLQDIVAVTQCNPNLQADVALLFESPDGLRRMRAEPAIVHGVASVVAAVFDFGDDGLAPDTRALLEITLRDAIDPCRQAVLRDEFRAPPVPWTSS